MARGPMPYIVQKTAGDAVVGATITIAIRGGGAATVFANQTGGTLASSPLLTDADGKVAVWLDEGSYDVTASGSGITTTTRPIEVLNGTTTFAVADASVTTNKIVALAVTNAKLAAGAVDNTKVVAGSLTNTELATSVFTGFVPIGSIGGYAGATDPGNIGGGVTWLIADGRLVSKVTFATFFTLAGHKYNGGVDPGGSQVRLPDYRGRTLVGPDNMGSTGAAGRLTTSAKVTGQSGGEEFHTLIGTETPVQTHAHSGGFTLSAVLSFPQSDDFSGRAYPGTNVLSNILSSGGTGWSTANASALGVGHNNMQPYGVDTVIVRVA